MARCTPFGTGRLLIFVGLLSPAIVTSGASAQSKKPAQASTLSAQKRAILATLRRQMPGRSQYFAFDSGDLDGLLQVEWKRRQIEPGLITDDESFVRRAYLDAAGIVPKPDELEAFLKDIDRDKRSKLIDKLLRRPEHARNWARFWRDVILYRADFNPKRVSPERLQAWLESCFAQNRGWDVVATELVASDGKDMNQGPDNFWLANGSSPTKMAAETARVFMGISIQCAECHDHPFDQWKRDRFHELAAFFARGKYYTPDQDDPAKKALTNPRFLLGERLSPKPFPTVKLGLGEKKRVAVAAYLVYNRRNHWFPRAYVNRVWNELFGDGFYAVDSLGPDNEVVYPMVVNRLAAVFRSYGFRPRWLFETIMKSDAYQRVSIDGEEAEGRFSSLRPSRLRGDQIADNLLALTGGSAKSRAAIVKTFQFDPSTPQRDIEGSIQQALLLMNNPGVQAGLSRKSNLVRALLRSQSDRELIEAAFLRVLARHPRGVEMRRWGGWFKSAKNRAEITEDLVWTLVNSAEFLTKR